MSGTPPEGWDPELSEELLEAARGLRVTYLALIAVGFAAAEAAQIIGATLAAQTSAAQRSTP